MSKFHVGDQVRVVGMPGKLYSPGEDLDFLAVIKKVNENEFALHQTTYQVYNDSRTLTIFEEHLRPAVIEPLAETDSVNHPAHYNRFGGAEVIDITEHLSFNLGNAIKYFARAGHKDVTKTEEDIRKGIWYANREIERLNKGVQ